MKSLHHLSAALPALLLPSLLWSAGAASAAELVINGGFEHNGGVASSSFTGWQSDSQAGSRGGFFAQQGGRNTLTPVAVSAPQEGVFAAMSDQAGPGRHTLYQDITIPAGQAAHFSASVYVQNAVTLAAAPASLDFTGPAPNQQARIDVVATSAALDDVGSGVLRALFQWPPAGSVGPFNASGAYQAVQGDLSAYAGQTVRLRITEVDNRQSLFFGVDAVSVQTGPGPGALGAPGNLTYLVQGGDVALSFSSVASLPGQTVTGYTAQCTPQGGGVALTGSAAGSPVHVTALLPGSSYDCKVAATAGAGTGPYSQAVSFSVPIGGGTVIPLPPGIPGSPGSTGGGSAVVSLTGAGGAGTTCTLPSASFIPVQSAPAMPPQGAAAFPFGLLNIHATGCASGSVVQVNVELPQDIPAGAQYWKYGPTPGNATPHWYPFSGFSVLGKVMTLSILDGAEGDDDLLANGEISDPGGIMVPVSSTATPVPLWGLGGWLSASAVLALACLGLRRKRLL